MASWGPDGSATGPPAPRVQEQICGVEPRHSRQPRERGFHGNPPPRELGLPGSQLQLLRGEVLGGGGGIAQRWGSGPPLIPPSQTLIRLQMADGSHPSPISLTKAGRGLPTGPVGRYLLREPPLSVGLRFSPLTREDTEGQRGQGIGWLSRRPWVGGGGMSGGKGWMAVKGCSRWAVREGTRGQLGWVLTRWGDRQQGNKGTHLDGLCL